ncbi:hypothetical protein ACIGG6_09260 [Vreelandella lionensis]|uniref:Secreted protein n=1 Tax=Vreelandella lionensis TaxID=1144478 RepID=A0ABW8BU82_9GAMM|nr:hypothetical protein [Halomonas sp. 707B3]MCP1316341.1 hypothetical protein [Halomonas sp. 707B3]
MMSRLNNTRWMALLFSALLMAGVLSGCGDAESPTTESEELQPDEPQEPMDTGPMSNDGQATREAPGDGVTD